jgi:WD40 repeat protein
MTLNSKISVYKIGLKLPFMSLMSFLSVCLLIIFISIAIPGNAFAGEKGWLGVQVQPVTGKNMRILHMEYGRGEVIFVSDVIKGSPAEQMGIKQDDVILSVNYKDIKNTTEFVDAVSALSPGDRIVLLVAPSKEKARFITGTMGKYPGAAATEQIRKPSEQVKPVVTDVSAKIFAPIGNHRIISLSFSPDGKHIIAGGDMKNSLKLWDIATGKEIGTLTGHTEDRIGSVAFSPDSKYALSGSSDKTVKLWEVATGKEIRTFIGHTELVFSVAFSPDGRYAASGSKDKTLKLWDVSSGKELISFSGHADAVNTIAFSPDGRYLLSGSFDKTIKLWDAATGNEVRTFTGHAWQLSSVAFSPDGRYAFSRSGDRIIKIWDINTGNEIRTFSADDVDASGRPSGSQMVIAGAFSPDGRYMLTTGRLGTAKLWDFAAGKAIKIFPGHTGWVPSLAFSKDSKSFISGGYDGSIRLWDINTGKETAQFISLKDGEWIVLTSEGYYNSSPNGHKYLNIRLGNKVYGIDQFYDVFYRPDVVAAKLRGDDISSLVTLTIDEAIKNPPPTVEFSSVPAETDQSGVQVCYRVNSTGGGIGEVRLFQNGKLIQSDGYYKDVARTSEKMQLASLNSDKIYQDMRNIKIKNVEEISPIKSSVKGEEFSDCKKIDAIPGENEISLSAFNSSNTVQSYMQTAKFVSTIKPEEPHLYILSIGIDQYKDKSVNLKYALKDAKDINAKLLSQSATLYKSQNIHSELLIDKDATKTNILGKINDISQKIKPSDSFILFVAGHGVLLQNQYYMLTHDYDGAVSNNNLISSNEIVEMSKKIKSLSQLFVFDTCHAGGVDYIVSGLYDSRMSVLAKKMGLHIYASANDKQAAMDGYKGNGLFTYVLLDGLNNNKEADKNKDGKISIVGLGEYSKKMTTIISRQIGHEQTPLIINFGKDSPLYKLQ